MCGKQCEQFQTKKKLKTNKCTKCVDACFVCLFWVLCFVLFSLIVIIIIIFLHLIHLLHTVQYLFIYSVDDLFRWYFFFNFSFEQTILCLSRISFFPVIRFFGFLLILNLSLNLFSALWLWLMQFFSISFLSFILKYSFALRAFKIEENVF